MTQIAGAEYHEHMRLIEEALADPATFADWDPQGAAEAKAETRKRWSLAPEQPRPIDYERLERQHEITQTRAMKIRARAYDPDAEMVSRQEIVDRDDSTCYLCETRVEPADIHIDHIIPLCRGGTHTADNLAVTHAACNTRKGGRLTSKRPPALATLRPTPLS